MGVHIYNHCMPRPRTVPDSDVLHAAMTVIQRIGPHALTLQDVSAATGLSPATLIQRFGSKRGLLLELVKLGATGTVEECVAALLAKHRSPLKALVAAATGLAELVSTPQELAHSLAFLHLEISDVEFQPWAARHSQMMLESLEILIRKARDAGELVRCQPRRLAQALSAVSGGSLVNWAIHRRGSVKAWVKQDVMQLLGPYRRK